LSSKVYLINVGANASHRFCSPLFADGTFEFLPIPEDRDLPGTHAVHYRDLRSHYDPSSPLTPFVPARLLEWPAHNDPEFATFTYGDNCEASPRAASLKRVEAGDRLLFIARLCPWKDSRPTHRHGFYLIGFLEVEEVLRDARARPNMSMLSRFRNNAHVRRGMSDPALWDRFWAFRGSARSRRFPKAVPITKALASRLFTDANGAPWSWGNGRTELQTIGSYTRSCRCILDPSLPDHCERIRALWAWVERHAGAPS
jgi:hypothetical protein